VDFELHELLLINHSLRADGAYLPGEQTHSHLPVTDKDAEQIAAGAWLDGLAGRDGASPAHVEGSRIRLALQPTDVEVTPGHSLPAWKEIERTAESSEAMTQAVFTVPVPTQKTSAPSIQDPVSVQPVADRKAANSTRWWALVAGIAITAGVGFQLMPPGNGLDEPKLRGLSPGKTSDDPVVWYASEPRQAAETLAAELRANGATVELNMVADGADLAVATAGASLDAVATTLVTVKAGLDMQGRAKIQVRKLP
jgi:hypothetical protein